MSISPVNWVRIKRIILNIKSSITTIMMVPHMESMKNPLRYRIKMWIIWTRKKMILKTVKNELKPYWLMLKQNFILKFLSYALLFYLLFQSISKKPIVSYPLIPSFFLNPSHRKILNNCFKRNSCVWLNL